MSHIDTNYNTFIGIDIAKDSFEVFFLGEDKSLSFKNSKRGLETFFKKFRTELESGFVVLENTGGYEEQALEYLTCRSVDVHRANGRHVRNFIRSFGIQAKTDSIDAKQLARYGKERHEDAIVYKLPTEAEKLLKTLNSRRGDLVHRLGGANNEAVKEDIAATIDFLTERIKQIETRMAEVVNNDEVLKRKFEIAQTVPGIGPTLAYELLANVRELGTTDHRHIASLLGLAPISNDSGNKSGYRRTKGGRRGVKAKLIQGTTGAQRCCSDTRLAEFSKKLRDKGKKPKVVKVAVARKMITIVNARFRDHIYRGIPFEN